MRIAKEIVKYSDGGYQKTEDHIVSEEILEITINSAIPLKISAIPEFHLELLYGLLLTSGTIQSKSEIKSVQIDGNRIEAVVPEKTGSGLSIGASGSRMVESVADPLIRDEFASLPSFDVRPVFRKFRQMSDLFEKTGAVHSSALLSTEGEILFFSEDVGRHNAIDKTIGKALAADFRIKDAFLMTSGRISGEIARKSAYAGLKGILSPSAPTSLAVETAEKFRLTMAGFIRENRYNIYTVGK